MNKGKLKATIFILALLVLGAAIAAIATGRSVKNGGQSAADTAKTAVSACQNQPDGREKSPYLLRPPAATASGFVYSSRLLLAVPPESDNRCARLDRRRASPWHSARIQLAPSRLIRSGPSSGAPVVLCTTFAHDSSCSTAVLVSA